MPARCWIAPEMPTAIYSSRRDDLAGLSDLVVVGHEAGIDRRARRAERGVQLVGELFEHA